jgi:hypothetical protein
MSHSLATRWHWHLRRSPRPPDATPSAPRASRGPSSTRQPEHPPAHVHPLPCQHPRGQLTPIFFLLQRTKSQVIPRRRSWQRHTVTCTLSAMGTSTKRRASKGESARAKKRSSVDSTDDETPIRVAKVITQNNNPPHHTMNTHPLATLPCPRHRKACNPSACIAVPLPPLLTHPILATCIPMRLLRRAAL